MSTIKEIDAKISQYEKSGVIDIDSRIELSEALTDLQDQVSNLVERLGNIQDDVEEVEGRPDARLAFVESIMPVTVDFEDEAENMEVAGKPDFFRASQGEGVRLAGNVIATLATPFALNGPYEVSVEISKVEGAWDKGDFVKIQVGGVDVYSQENNTPKSGTFKTKVEFEDAQDVKISVGNNNSGGSSGGSAEFITIKSMTLTPIR